MSRSFIAEVSLMAMLTFIIAVIVGIGAVVAIVFRRASERGKH